MYNSVNDSPFSCLKILAYQKLVSNLLQFDIL